MIQEGGKYMYEAPKITELGSVADFTREDSPNQVIDGFLSLGPREPTS